MKAVRFHGPGDMRVEEVEKPRIQHPEDLILAVTMTTICGTDLHPYRGTRPRARGSAMGHECVGLVDEVGAQVKHVRPGDRVVVPAMVCCGYCAYCTEGYTSQCVTEGAGTIRGAQAEYVRVPFATASVLPIPAGMTDEAALTLTDVFPTAYFACHLADIHEGEAVAVFGSGPIGLFAMHAARLMGAGRIFAVDYDPDRLEVAARQGFHSINFEELDPVEAIRVLTGGYGADACIEAVGTDAVDRHAQRDPLVAVRWCIETVKVGGHVSVVGLFTEADGGFPLYNLLNKNATLRAGYGNHRRYLPRLMQILQQGLFDPTFLYSGAIALEDLAAGYAQFDTHAHLKLIVRTEAGRRQLEARAEAAGISGVAWVETPRRARAGTEEAG